MSGGILFAAALPFAMIGSAIAETAAATAAVVASGSVAAYDQIKIAGECRKAIASAKEDRKKYIQNYEHQAQLFKSSLEAGTKRDIDLLTRSLKSAGIAVPPLTGDPEAILLTLLELEAKHRVQTFTPIFEKRTPANILNSIYKIIGEFIADIPEGTAEYQMLAGIKAEAEKAAKSDNTVSDRILLLNSAEAKLIASTYALKASARKYRSHYCAYVSGTVAIRKLGEAVGKRVRIPAYDPINWESQIRALNCKAAELREDLKSVAANSEYTKKNAELSQKITESVESFGLKKINYDIKSFGSTSVFEYRNSLLSVVVSKEGKASINLIKKPAESDEIFAADEKHFCDTDSPSLIEHIKASGILLFVNSINSADGSEIYSSSASGSEESEYYTEPLYKYAD